MPLGFPNNKGADQPAHLRSLIRAFVIRVVKGIKHVQIHCIANWYIYAMSRSRVKLQEIGTSWGRG